jgi:uncharacterized protein YdhG (YjbR/CyaY superfamily)
MQSNASTVEDYVAELPPERRAVVQAVHDVVATAMPEGYQEGVAWGMVTWSVPLERYPTTYNKQPLAYVSLAAQKRHYALYLMGVYADSEKEQDFRRRWEAGGRKLNMGKSCLRFKALEDLDLDLVAAVVSGTSVDDYIARYKAARGL